MRARSWLALAALAAAPLLAGGGLLWGAHRYVTENALRQQLAPSDVIVTLGAAVQTNGRPNRCLQARVNRAAGLYQQGLAAHVIVSGGKDSGTGLIEAEHMARWLEQAGVPPDAIIQEPRASSTAENIAFSAPILAGQGWRRVLLVSDPYHLPRATALARREGWEVHPAPATDSICWTLPVPSRFYTWRETALVMRDLSLGELLGWG